MATAVKQRPRLKEAYFSKMRPALKDELGLININQVPRITKIVVNAGIGEGAKDFKVVETLQQDLALITGQKPALRRARKDIAGFNIRKGNPIGLQVTMRGNRMYEFLDRLVNIALPRVRDFRGLRPSIFDGKGNLTIGIREHTVFPEVNIENVQKVRGFSVSIATNAGSDVGARALCRQFGVPIAEKN